MTVSKRGGTDHLELGQLITRKLTEKYKSKQTPSGIRTTS